ncbi:hypothetical protein D9757_013169 [Collybiopsis confluens]|uniref:Uncharacterized protein n=1 Tax=Collybiopsis confluens TaxID=2823264 RepID=A0A8H5D5N4_9AGAR|nr:hypothetical protein D9757_013169 [Collybiopsis confluens]
MLIKISERGAFAESYSSSDVGDSQVLIFSVYYAAPGPFHSSPLAQLLPTDSSSALTSFTLSRPLLHGVRVLNRTFRYIRLIIERVKNLFDSDEQYRVHAVARNLQRSVFSGAGKFRSWILAACPPYRQYIYAASITPYTVARSAATATLPKFSSPFISTIPRLFVYMTAVSKSLPAHPISHWCLHMIRNNETWVSFTIHLIPLHSLSPLTVVCSPFAVRPFAYSAAPKRKLFLVEDSSAPNTAAYYFAIIRATLLV